MAKYQSIYEVVAKYRRGWSLVRIREGENAGKHFMRKNFGGMYPVNVQKSGFASFIITDAEGNRVNPASLR